MTVHKKMPDIVRDGARQMGMLLEQAIAGGQLSQADLFDDAYRPIPNTRPQKYSSRFDSLTDRIFPVSPGAAAGFVRRLSMPSGPIRTATCPLTTNVSPSH
jgi:hypothetical protein